MLKVILHLINLGFAIFASAFLLKIVGKGTQIAGEARSAIQDKLKHVSVANKSILEIARAVFCMVIIFICLSIPILNILLVVFLYKNEDELVEKISCDLVKSWDKSHPDDVEN